MAVALAFSPVSAGAALGLAAVLMLAFAVWRWPMAFVRGLLWIITHTAYRVRVGSSPGAPDVWDSGKVPSSQIRGRDVLSYRHRQPR